MTGWITNSTEHANQLRKADRAYDRAAEAAKGMILADKIVALRDAKAARQAAYDTIAI